MDAETLDEIAADIARLDWLEKMANLPGGLLLHDGTETGRLGLGLRPGNVVRTLRDAIDSAMLEPNGPLDAVVRPQHEDVK